MNSMVFSGKCHVSGEDRQIPLLEEVFKEFQKTPVNVDIKINDDKLIEKVKIKS